MKGGDLSKKVCIFEYPLLLRTDSGLPNERRLKRNHHRRHIASSRTRIGEEERAPAPKKSFQGKWSDRVGESVARVAESFIRRLTISPEASKLVPFPTYQIFIIGPHYDSSSFLVQKRYILDSGIPSFRRKRVGRV